MIDVPRIAYDELPGELKHELRAKVERLGYLGEFFQVAAHQPVALAHFIRFTETLKDVLPVNLVELCALTISTWSGNAYERVQHERLALKLGFSEDWVREIERLEPKTATRLSVVEQAAQSLALAMAQSQGRDAGGEADTLLRLTDVGTLISVLLTTARYIAHSAVCNTLKLTAPVASPLERRA